MTVPLPAPFTSLPITGSQTTSIDVWASDALRAYGDARAAEAAAEFKADAERYRWINRMASCIDTVGDPDNFIRVYVGDRCYSGRSLAAAIDAARGTE